MKKLLGVTKKEVTEGFLFGVEIEYNDGYREWKKGNYAECSEMAKGYSKKGMFSDFDMMCANAQPEHLKEVAEFWFKKRETKCGLTMNELFEVYGEEA